MSREKFHQIKDLQKFNGSFVLDPTFGQCLGLNANSIEQTAKSEGWEPNAFATVVALVYFQKKLGGLAADWELIADKSKRWLLNNHRDKADDMYEAAVKII